MEFDDIEAVKDWMDRNQLGRRNLSPEDFRLLSGRIYNRRKRQGERTDLTSRQVGGKLQTADEVAGELGVSPRTIERNGQRAEVYDSLIEYGDAEAADVARTAPQALVSEAARLTTPESKAAVVRAHVAHNSGSNEWYTPAKFIEAAREVMGGIDLDPASCAIANETVQAAKYYDAESDGLAQEWGGRVWMNPPYSQPAIKQFCDKLAEAVSAGDVTDAIALVNNATETAWFQMLWACCRTRDRS